MKNEKEYAGIFGLIILGFVFGILSKAGDVAVQGYFLGDTLYAFGLVTSGIFIWVVVCTAISILSKNKFWAAVNIFFFLASMLLAYYLYSYFVVDYLVLRVVKFWIIMLIPALVLGIIIRSVKTNKILRYAAIFTGTLIMIVEMFVFQGGFFAAIIIDIILYVIFLRLITSKCLKNSKKKELHI